MIHSGSTDVTLTSVVMELVLNDLKDVTDLLLDLFNIRSQEKQWLKAKQSLCIVY